MTLHRSEREHPNADLARRAFAAFKAGDHAAVAELFAPDIVWTVGGAGRASGTTHGIAGVIQNAMDIMAWTAGTYVTTPLDFLGSDDHAVVLLHVTATRPDGRRLDQGEVVVFVVRAQRLVEARHLCHDEAAWTAFFA
jgi:uncharacterized protein (TIGR02246 family)